MTKGGLKIGGIECVGDLVAALLKFDQSAAVECIMSSTLEVQGWHHTDTGELDYVEIDAE